MIAAVKAARAPGFSFKEVKEPKIGDSEVLIRSKVASICGTDLSIYLWNDWAQGRIKKIPLTIGHEFAGEVVEVGKNVNSIEVGDIVSAETHIFCNECYPCRNNRRHLWSTGTAASRSTSHYRHRTHGRMTKACLMTCCQCRSLSATQ